MRLTVVLTDFFPDAAELTAPDLPRLPGIEWLLQQGKRAPAGQDARLVLTRALGPAGLASQSPAGLAAALVPAAQPPLWIASPVHLTAGLNHVRMHRAGLLRLQPAELALLARDFSAVFADARMELLPLQGGLLLQGLALTNAHAQDPARCLGADIAGFLPGGEGGAALRGLGAELEMWLHEHALNRVRAVQRQLPVTTLWLWGGSAPAAVEWGAEDLPGPVAVFDPQVQVYADDMIVAGLCRAANRALLPLPASFADVPAPAASDRIVVLSAAPRDAHDAPLPRIDAQWVLPAVVALRSGALEALTLLAGGQVAGFERRPRWQFWQYSRRAFSRRERPWWESFR